MNEVGAKQEPRANDKHSALFQDLTRPGHRARRIWKLTNVDLGVLRQRGLRCLAIGAANTLAVTSTMSRVLWFLRPTFLSVPDLTAVEAGDFMPKALSLIPSSDRFTRRVKPCILYCRSCRCVGAANILAVASA